MTLLLCLLQNDIKQVPVVVSETEGLQPTQSYFVLFVTLHRICEHVPELTGKDFPVHAAFCWW